VAPYVLVPRPPSESEGVPRCLEFPRRGKGGQDGAVRQQGMRGLGAVRARDTRAPGRRAPGSRARRDGAGSLPALTQVPGGAGSGRFPERQRPVSHLQVV